MIKYWRSWRCLSPMKWSFGIILFLHIAILFFKRILSLLEFILGVLYTMYQLLRWNKISPNIALTVRGLCKTFHIKRRMFLFVAAFTWGRLLHGKAPYRGPQSRHRCIYWLCSLNQACLVWERRSVRSSYPPFWFESRWRYGGARNRSLLGRGVLTTPAICWAIL